MIVPLFAGATKTLVVSMLSKHVLLRVLLMLSDGSSAKSTTSLVKKDRNRNPLKVRSEWETLMWTAYSSSHLNCRRWSVLG